MYPMISAIALKTRKRTSPITLDFVLRSCGLSSEDISKTPDSTPIALLVNDWTGS